MRNVVIVGGGLGGLISGIQLAKAGIPVKVIEKKSYPLHRVCGEYISNETISFLKENDLYPGELNPPHINEFQLSSIQGKSAKLRLDLGGFGVSRFAFDHYLYEKAKREGVQFSLHTEVTNVSFNSERFVVETDKGNEEAFIVVGAYGKRSRMDAALERTFMKKRSPYVGVKYHIRYSHPDNLIALHNFPLGYCGISNVEGGKTNLCYLTHRDNLRQYKDIRAMEEAVLFINPLLKEIFSSAEFLFDKPEVINEISFETKGPIEDHILMVGDAAGMITPLCGNGMAMAIHSAKLLSENIIAFTRNEITRKELEQRYATLWKKFFAYRLWKGRQIQNLFGNRTLSNLAVNLALHSRPLANALVRNTHGKSF